MSSKRITVAAVQMTSGTNSAKNVDDATELVHRASDEGASYVQLPEYFNFYGPARQFDQASETIPGPTTTRMAEIARERSITLHLGSMAETNPDGAKPFNTSVLINEHGEIVATYRKVHLFDIAVPDAITYEESAYISSGNDIVVAPTTNFNLGFSICFDVRFGELYRSLALHGAHVVSVPAAFSSATGPAHWEVLLRARAIENHVFIVAATQVGETAEGLSTHGHAMIVDPWGEVLAESKSQSVEVVVTTIDVDDVQRRREQIDVLGLRRPRLYDIGP